MAPAAKGEAGNHCDKTASDNGITE